MKHWIALFFTVIIIGTQIRGCIISSYEFESRFEYAWQLADKSSTLDAKSNYINEFVTIIEANRNEFSDHNAVFLKTNDNKFDNNLKALKTLRDRLEQIKLMNPNSFEYQVAIQQITAQEQGEATKMLLVIKGCWELTNYWYIWGWISLLLTLLPVLWWAVWGGIILINDL